MESMEVEVERAVEVDLAGIGGLAVTVEVEVEVAEWRWGVGDGRRPWKKRERWSMEPDVAAPLRGLRINRAMERE